jgi:hypothetical protein
MPWCLSFNGRYSTHNIRYLWPQNVCELLADLLKVPNLIVKLFWKPLRRLRLTFTQIKLLFLRTFKLCNSIASYCCCTSADFFKFRLPLETGTFVPLQLSLLLFEGLGVPFRLLDQLLVINL